MSFLELTGLTVKL